MDKKDTGFGSTTVQLSSGLARLIGMLGAAVSSDLRKLQERLREFNQAAQADHPVVIVSTPHEQPLFDVNEPEHDRLPRGSEPTSR